MNDQNSGKLRIGDNWNAIRIIALSQSNPLKAVAEFVENSIDARAKHITLVRGKENGVHFLRLKDDGDGIRRNAEGLPDFESAAEGLKEALRMVAGQLNALFVGTGAFVARVLPRDQHHEASQFTLS
jgi:hypothetical protein